MSKFSFLFMRREKEETGGQVARNYVSFPVCMNFWPITQTNIPQLRTIHTYKIESKIFTPFVKSCIQVALWQHASLETERKSVFPSPELYCGNDDRLSMPSNVRKGMKQRHNGIFNTSAYNTSTSENCWWPRLKQVRRTSTKPPQDIIEVMWAKIW